MGGLAGGWKARAMARRRREPHISRLHVGELELMVIGVDASDASDVLEELTAAEREVARMAVDGLSDAVIASRRGTSRSTVANQLRRVYQKLGIASRAELAARVATGG